MKFFKRINEGEVIPKCYGVCWYDVNRYAAICAPIGLNVIIGFARKIYFRIIICIQPDIYQRLLLKKIIFDRQLQDEIIDLCTESLNKALDLKDLALKESIKLFFENLKAERKTYDDECKKNHL